MDDMTLLKELRAATPQITPEAEQAARASLMNAARGADPAEHRAGRGVRVLRMPRMVWRMAAAGALAVGIVTAFTVAQNVGVDGRHPGRPGVLPGAPVANAAELGERAAHNAASEPGAGPNQWTYVKRVEAGISDYSPGVTRERVAVERWINLANGKLTIRGVSGETRQGAAAGFPDASKLATSPDALRRQVYALAAKDAEPGGSRDLAAFQTIQEIMDKTAPAPRVQAALYRVLPRIPGVTLRRDAVDAKGRHGVAFALVGSGGNERSEIILNAKTYRYLGFRSVAVRDYVEKEALKPRTGNGPGVDANVRAGTVLEWTAQLAKSVVDRPGVRS